MEKLPLPSELEPYRSILEGTQTSYIAIQPKKESTTLYQSKFGGNPYFPKNQDYPYDEQGVPLFLLAQINFEEVPHLEPYPTSGILQFFVSFDDDIIGIDFNDYTNQQNFRVIYHEELLSEEELIQDFSFLPPAEEGTLPLVDEMKLTFELKEEFVSLSDFQFEELLGGKLDLEQEIGNFTLWDLYIESIHNMGHKIGGYAYFTQSDVREGDSNYEHHKYLLLQIDSDDDNNIMWGDVGVGNFFITEEDLKKRDFSKVLYTWDCC